MTFIKVTRSPDKCPMLINARYIVQVRPHKIGDEESGCVLVMSEDDPLTNQTLYICENYCDIVTGLGKKAFIVDLREIADKRKDREKQSAWLARFKAATEQEKYEKEVKDLNLLYQRDI